MISSQLPDISIVYKLHLESGELINIYDWMRAFHAIVTSESNEEDDEISEENQLVLFLLKNIHSYRVTKKPGILVESGFDNLG